MFLQLGGGRSGGRRFEPLWDFIFFFRIEKGSVLSRCERASVFHSSVSNQTTARTTWDDFFFFFFSLNRDSDKRGIDPSGEKKGEKNPPVPSVPRGYRPARWIGSRAAGGRDEGSKLPFALKAACRSASKSAFIPSE